MSSNLTQGFDLTFAYAYGEPKTSAGFRERPEDFIVNEELGFEPAGHGDHVLLLVKKTDTNTHTVARNLAQYASLKLIDIGFCGLKDRHAVCQQWFSLHLPGAKEFNSESFNQPGIAVLDKRLHTHKLRRGQHRANHFEITLRGVREAPALLQRLEKVSCAVPNYFGEQRFGNQRFGNNANNLVEGDKWARDELKLNMRRNQDKVQRGWYMSALRSYLFNVVLSQRVQSDNWCKTLSGDANNNAPSGPLWGRGRSLVSEQTEAIESEVLLPWAKWRERLEFCGLKQERRPLVCHPQNFNAEFANDNLVLKFSLPPGQFATSVLREISQLKKPLAKLVASD